MRIMKTNWDNKINCISRVDCRPQAKIKRTFVFALSGAAFFFKNRKFPVNVFPGNQCIPKLKTHTSKIVASIEKNFET